MSQLALAHEAGVSPRHVCFLEIGRANPSREMVLLLAARPRRAPAGAERAAPGRGLRADVHRDGARRAPQMEQRSQGPVAMILQHQEPYPAVVMDRHWKPMLTCNSAAERFFAELVTLPKGRPPSKTSSG